MSVTVGHVYCTITTFETCVLPSRTLEYYVDPVGENCKTTATISVNPNALQVEVPPGFNRRLLFRMLFRDGDREPCS